MRAKLAYFVIVLSGLGVLLAAASPALMRARTYHQFHLLGMDSVADTVSRNELHAAAPALALGFILSAAGVFIGVGLLRRREWARRAWLLVCALWLVSSMVLVALSPSLSGILPLIFRLLIFIVSFRILVQPAIRNEFSTDYDAKRA